MNVKRRNTTNSSESRGIKAKHGGLSRVDMETSCNLPNRSQVPKYMQTQKMINWYFINFLYHTTCLAFYSFSIERGFRYKKYLLFNIIKLMETGLSDRNLNKRARSISLARGVLREAENFSARFCRLVERTCNRTAILHPSLRPSRATGA